MNSILFFRSELMEFVLIKDKQLRFGEHCHTSCIVLTAVLKGKAVLTREGAAETKGEGDIFTVMPYENHSLTSAAGVSVLSMCIKKALFLSPLKEFDDVISAAVKGMAGKGLLPVGYVQRLTAEARAAYTSFANSRNAKADPVLVTERCSIEEHPETEENIDESSRRAYMSKYHFIRSFRRISGLTPHKFRIQNRVRKAQAKLSEGVSVAAAAQLSGFYDQSHFDRYFKKIVGICPRDYVESLSNFLQE